MTIVAVVLFGFLLLLIRQTSVLEQENARLRGQIFQGAIAGYRAPSDPDLRDPGYASGRPSSHTIDGVRHAGMFSLDDFAPSDEQAERLYGPDEREFGEPAREYEHRMDGVASRLYQTQRNELVKNDRRGR